MIKFFKLIWREGQLHRRQMHHAFLVCLFFLIILILFPLTLPAMMTLRKIAPGFIWLALFFAILLSSERLFQQEYEEGVLEQWVLSNTPLRWFIHAKLCVHWLFCILPLLALCPMWGLLYAMSMQSIAAAMVGILCGSPAMLYICAFTASLQAGFKHKGMLMGLLVLPLAIPILILGSLVIISTQNGLPASGYFALLTAMSLLAIIGLPEAMASVLRLCWME
jgi:heme exporter protein B